ncbi:MAG: hypothetical protein ACOYL6_11745 [Bacteriovoracaceae bacterium]
MRTMTLFLAYFFCFGLCRAQTLVSWNFATDSENTVLDSGPYHKNGSPFQAPLIQIAQTQGRHFSKENSLIDFGPTSGGALDLKGITDFTFSALIKLDQENSFTTLFDNGQFNISLIDNHISVFLKTFYGQAALIAQHPLVLNGVHSTAILVTFDYGQLSLSIDGNEQGEVNTFTSTVDYGTESSSILVGERFRGLIERMEFSSLSRFDVTPPLVAVVSPTQLSEHLELEVVLSDNKSGVDLETLEVYFNGEQLTNLEFTESSIKGTLPYDQALMVQELYIVVSDRAGNHREVELLLEPLNKGPSQIRVEAQKIALFEDDTCVITNMNDLRCSTNSKASMSPVLVSSGQPLRDLTMVDLGRKFGCAIGHSGDVYCWNKVDFLASRIMGLANATVSLSVGPEKACMVLESGEMWCFGEDFIPSRIDSNVDYLEVSLSEVGGYVCVVTKNGLVKCGEDVQGMLPIHRLEGAEKVLVSGQSACGQLVDQTVYCWKKENPNAQLVESLHRVVEIKGVQESLCALTEAHDLYCWNLKNAQSIISQVKTSSAISQFDLGSRRACAVLENGETKCWGYL